MFIGKYICCFWGFFGMVPHSILYVVSSKVMFDDENALIVVVNEVKHKLFFGACEILYDMLELLSK